mmetsp:Transcript_23128/g.59083  ORF Transcript_23128/g.59083 Transcript_23128/m.59083 type:complete len:284 (+) Transcript_23128:1395-2246(+)
MAPPGGYMRLRKQTQFHNTSSSVTPAPSRLCQCGQRGTWQAAAPIMRHVATAPATLARCVRPSMHACAVYAHRPPGTPRKGSRGLTRRGSGWRRWRAAAAPSASPCAACLPSARAARWCARRCWPQTACARRAACRRRRPCPRPRAPRGLPSQTARQPRRTAARAAAQRPARRRCCRRRRGAAGRVVQPPTRTLTRCRAPRSPCAWLRGGAGLPAASAGPPRSAGWWGATRGRGGLPSGCPTCGSCGSSSTSHGRPESCPWSLDESPPCLAQTAHSPKTRTPR